MAEGTKEPWKPHREPIPGQKNAHMGKMPNFKQIRPTYEKVRPFVNNAVEHGLEENQNPDVNKHDLSQQLRRAAFRTAAPLQQKIEETEEKRYIEEALRKQAEEKAMKDPLTGLGNKEFYNTAIQIVREQTIRHRGKFTVAFLDMNNFKEINDTLGHQEGDAVLQRIASTLRIILRRQDIIARWGGDEFAVLLPETDQDGTIFIIEKVLRILREEAKMAASIGLVISDGTEYPDEILKHADIALYESKKKDKSKGAYTIYTPDLEEQKTK